MVVGNKLYGNQSDSAMCIPIEGADLKEQLRKAIKNISGNYTPAEVVRSEKKKVQSDAVDCPPNTKKFTYVVQNDTVYFHKTGSTMETVKAKPEDLSKIKLLVDLRNTVNNIFDLQLDNVNGTNDIKISEARKALGEKYDNFSSQYGLISDKKIKRIFGEDSSYHLLKALEVIDSNGEYVGKADIFTKNTMRPRVVTERADNATDALILSLSERMSVDLDYMSKITGMSEETLINELADKIYQNPEKGMRWESADEYLSGNIRQKLKAAESVGLEKNIKALEEVMPKRINANEIAVKLGSAWIDPSYIKQFIVETLKPDYNTARNLEVIYSPATDKWKIEGYKKAYNNTLATQTYGTAYMSAYELIELTLNMKKVEVKERVTDQFGYDIQDQNGRYVTKINHEKTMVVQSKQDELKRKFEDWIFDDPERREYLVNEYNEKFNNLRLREYDGSHLNFVGMNPDITLKEHQKNAVARGLYSNCNNLLAHEVGAGKTFEITAIAMEGKRLGLHSKSIVTAPNSLTEQWGDAFRTLYPNANILVATEDDFKPNNRRDFYGKIATGDWDAVIMGHTQFDMLHLSKNKEIEYLNSEIDKLEDALYDMKQENGGKKSFSVKQIEKSLKSHKEKLEKLLEKAPEDDMLCFEQLGVDKIFIDESQAYKNLDTPTKMQNVAGLGSGGSGRAMQLLMKCKYLDEVTGGKGVVFASGTPILTSYLLKIFKFTVGEVHSSPTDFLSKTEMNIYTVLIGNINPVNHNLCKSVLFFH